ncbi:MAG TPA: FAD-binding oxidoreductase [Anaerolineales bacterium]|nr:FAD-binding oxidoreductase [Anaerolineales bacterium]
MQRWNGWGDPKRTYHLPLTARTYLDELLGPGVHIPDADFQTALAAVPHSRLPDHPLLSTDNETRLLHARGQSLPDWIALRSGKIAPYPDGVATPETGDDVRVLLGFAQEIGCALIPYGGGTSVVGHINPLPGDRPSLTVDMRRMNQLQNLDEESRLAVFSAGVTGPEIEAQLKPHGFTLGHFPQSWELSTLGGWIATRSSGQQSYRYGRIEDLFAGGTMVTPVGTIQLRSLPASAAGPDLRQFVLGSEGRLGVITQAEVRVSPLPEEELFFGAFFRDWESGVAATRSLVQKNAPLSMARLSDPLETETTLALAGRERLIKFADYGLRLLGHGAGRSLLIYGITGNHDFCSKSRQEVDAILRRFGGLPVGAMIGRQWEKSRFFAPYLRNTLWDLGYALDTLETALPWRDVESARTDVLQSIEQAFQSEGSRTLVFSHLSHIYTDGASLYITYVFPIDVELEQTLHVWHKAKHAASVKIIANGGTISHQHGVGLDHLNYMKDEKGEAGLLLLEGARKALDPQGILNPGTSWPCS